MVKKKKSRPQKSKKQAPPFSPDALGVLFFSGSLFLFVSLMSFEYLLPEENWLGHFGYFLSLCLTSLFGLAAYLIPAYAFFSALRIFQYREYRFCPYELSYFALFTLSCSFLLTTLAYYNPSYAASFEGSVIKETVHLSLPYPKTLVRYHLGGIPFTFLFSDLPLFNLKKILSPIGTTLIFSSLGLVSFLLLTKLPLPQISKAILRGVIRAYRSYQSWAQKRREEKAKMPPPTSIEPKINFLHEKRRSPLPEKPREPIIKIPGRTKAAKKEITLPNVKPLLAGKGKHAELPSCNLLLDPTEKIDQPTLKKDLMNQACILEETLRSFGIEAKVGEINSGPTITSFEVHPSIGVKVQKIKALENDIALNMQAKSIRIVAPIPGKAAVGVEVPAIHPQEVNFKEMLQHYQQKNRKLEIPILIGKAVNGGWVFADLGKMPHLLIAGATGSGKSVCINTIVMSILMNASPDEVRLLMIDPKKVELTQYSSLPHMIAPVITEPHGAYAALQWLVKEMQTRYDILKQLGLRNITAFNQRRKNTELEESLEITIPEHMPYIVAIVDEFADLMMVSSADLETPIARIAQMARAVGIHLILATQRPSREVITGIIKANIPTRLSFKVASRINSQIILDEVGAESLLGNGDCLFLPPGTSQLCRAQGAYISDEEIHRITRFLSENNPVNYLIPSFDSYTPPEQEKPSYGQDALYDKALTIVLSSKSASTTFLQRKLKIGYARAAGLMDELEENGIISPQEGAKPRRVLTTMSLSDLEYSEE